MSDSVRDDLGSDPQHNRPIAGASNATSTAAAATPWSDGPSPASPRRARDPRLAAAEKGTRRLARRHYENFVVASMLLPRRLHQPFYNVYAFCRTADDLADESDSPSQALQRLERFQSDLDATFQGRPAEGLFVALADTVARFQLSKQPFDDLIDAFRQDQSKTRYQSFDEVLDYCRRSANPVGRIVLALTGAGSEIHHRLSDAICTGLQLANFLQDVANDYQRGRIYLPADQMRRFGVEEDMFARKETCGPMRNLLASECERAEAYLRDGLPLAERVPSWFASDVRLFAHGGLATLEAIRRIDFDVMRTRPKVSKSKQLSLLVRAALGWL